MLKKKDFAQFDVNGNLQALFCKVCGTPIAAITLRPKGPGPDINVMVPKFSRFPNYAEVKLQISDGSMHVTHGCRGCLTMGLTPKVMDEMYKCDMQEMGLLNKGRRAKELVALDFTAQGIV